MSSVASTRHVCTFCGTSLETIAIECPTCGKSIVSAPFDSTWNALTSGAHFAALWTLSFGLYSVVWFYRAWKFLQIEARAGVRPLARAIGLIVPLLGLYFVFSLFREIEDFTEGSTSEGNGAFIVFWVAAVVSYGLRSSSMILLQLIPHAAMGGAMWILQRRINGYYRAQPGIRVSRMPVYGWIVCVLGGLAWLGVLASLIVRA
jgi:hypothetical protein